MARSMCNPDRVTTLPLADARNHLSEVVDSVTRTHDRVTITRHGRPVAVVISPDDLETLEETLAWMSNGGIAAHQESRAQFAAGDTVDLEDLRAEFGAKSTPTDGT